MCHLTELPRYWGDVIGMVPNPAWNLQMQWLLDNVEPIIPPKQPLNPL